MKPSSLYIAGPMADIAEFNHPVFFEVEKSLNDLDIETVNPARLDALGGIANGASFEDGTGVGPLQRAAFLKRDFHWLTTMEGIVLLEGWEDSSGANCELLVSQIAGMSTWLWVAGNLYPEPNLTADLTLIFGHLNEVVWGVKDVNG